VAALTASRATRPRTAPLTGDGRDSHRNRQLVHPQVTSGVDHTTRHSRSPFHSTLVIPPSTYSTCPLTKSAADEERNSTPPTRSSVRPQRPAGVRRHQAVHHGQTGQRGDADAHQGVVAALGDHQHDRDQQDHADLEEQRQTDDGGDQDHRPRHRPAARPRQDRVDDLVGTAGVGEHLAEDRAEGDQHADAGDRCAEPGGEAGYHLVQRRSGDRAQHQRPDGQGQEGVQLEPGDEQDDDGDARHYGDAQLSVSGRGDRLGGVRCQHLDAESGHRGSLAGTRVGGGVTRPGGGARSAPSRPVR
jgi:hypothetical protein